MKKISLNKKRILRLGWPFAVLLCLTLIILRERIGIMLDDFTEAAEENYAARLYEVEDEAFSNPVEQEVECLVLNNTDEEASRNAWEQFEVVLTDMRIGFKTVDLAEEKLPELGQYDKAVVTISDLSVLGDNILVLCDWVEKGGHFLSTGTFQGNAYFEILASKAGVLNAGRIDYGNVAGMRVCNDFMINGEDREFTYSDVTETALDVSLMQDCIVYIEDNVSGLPLLWERAYGEGKFVISNQILNTKVTRGILCAAYSLLGDSCVYPVINGSAFYLDDFPAPVPSGDGKYITEEFGVGISSFYSNIWWPDMLEIQEKYDLVHTGLIIVEYSDQVEGPFLGNESKERYSFFGNMLLNNGGELGFHGYNHMPLCLDNYDYMGLYDSYEYWPSVEEMGESITTLYNFSSSLFPEERFLVYVPPSNILSEEGRRALKDNWKDLLVIASTYHEGEAAYTQEFEVAEDGIVETPRITSGCIFDEYTMLAAFSELNFHYVQSHFLHPDDILDEDRGAALGWTKMYENLTEYVDYIYTAAPDIRSLSGTGMGEAVREFDKLTVKKEESKTALNITLGGFYKEAYLMLRMNDGLPGTVTGGKLEHITGNLYMLHATSEEVTIEKEKL